MAIKQGLDSSDWKRHYFARNLQAFINYATYQLYKNIHSNRQQSKKQRIKAKKLEAQLVKRNTCQTIMWKELASMQKKNNELTYQTSRNGRTCKIYLYKKKTCQKSVVRPFTGELITKRKWRSFAETWMKSDADNSLLFLTLYLIVFLLLIQRTGSMVIDDTLKTKMSKFHFKQVATLAIKVMSQSQCPTGD